MEQIIAESKPCVFRKITADRELFSVFQDEIRAVKILCVFQVDNDASAALEETFLWETLRKFPEGLAGNGCLPACRMDVYLVPKMFGI